MIRFDTPLPPVALVIAVVVALLILTWGYLQLHGLIRPLFLGGLASLRLISCSLVFLFLINPYWIRREPDPSGFRVAVLVDASGSMETRDIENGRRTRAELAGDWLASSADSPLAALRERGQRLDIYLFSERSEPYTGDGFRMLPGSTAIGDALEEQLRNARSGGNQLGAVLLISDGHSNAGRPPMEVAQQFRRQGIPISAVGVGALTPPGEVRGQFARHRLQGKRGEPMDVPVRLSNTRDRDIRVRIELHDDLDMIGSREVLLPTGSIDHEEVFNIMPSRPGGQIYRLVVRPENEPEQTDVAAVQVNEPDVFRVLFLSGRPSPEFRFIQHAIKDSDQLQLQAVIRTGPKSFFHILASEKERLLQENAFPTDPAFYADFDGIIADAEALRELGESAVIIRDLVARRGGGLLLLGAANDLPGDIASALPVANVELAMPGRRQPLEISTAPVFTQAAGGVLFGRPPLFLDEGAAAAIAAGWRRGARPVLRIDGAGDHALMTAQAYGAGRAAHLGGRETWRWRLDSSTGIEQHTVFWRNTLAWLASNRQPRVNMPIQGQRVALAEELDLQIDVRGSDFRPEREATVTATITSPGRERRQLTLAPSMRIPGRYSAMFTPHETGKYRISHRISFGNNETLEKDAFFVVAPRADEMESVAFREDILRDLARVTNGSYWHYPQASRIREAPISREVPLREERRHLASNPLFLLLLAMPLFLEWYFRRNLGLK